MNDNALKYNDYIKYKVGEIENLSDLDVSSLSTRLKKIYKEASAEYQPYIYGMLIFFL